MGPTARSGVKVEVPVEHYGLIEGDISLVAVLASAAWQLWTPRKKKGDEDDK